MAQLLETDIVKAKEAVAQAAAELAEAKHTRAAMNGVPTAPQVKAQATRAVNAKATALALLESKLKSAEEVLAEKNAAARKRKLGISGSESDLTSIGSDGGEDLGEVEAKRVRLDGEGGVQGSVGDGAKLQDGAVQQAPTPESPAGLGIPATAAVDICDAEMQDGTRTPVNSMQATPKESAPEEQASAKEGATLSIDKPADLSLAEEASAPPPDCQVVAAEGVDQLLMTGVDGSSSSEAMGGTLQEAAAAPGRAAGNKQGRAKPGMPVGKVSAIEVLKRKEKERRAEEKEAIKKAKEKERAEKAQAALEVKGEGVLYQIGSASEGESDVKSKAQGKRPKKPRGEAKIPANALENMTPEAYKAAEEGAWKEVITFLEDPDHVVITETNRKRIREHPDFVPNGATISRALSMHLLTTGRGKDRQWCVYHHMLKRGPRGDKGNKNDYLFTGMPGEDVRDSGRVATSGCMDCGCRIEESLWDFIFWKTWKLSTTRNGEVISEGWAGQHLYPRARSFVVEAFKKSTSLELTDMYTGLQMDYMGLEHSLKLCATVNNKNSRKVVEILNTLSVPEHGRLKCLYKAGWDWLCFETILEDRGVLTEATPEETAFSKVLTARPIVLMEEI